MRIKNKKTSLNPSPPSTSPPPSSTPPTSARSSIIKKTETESQPKSLSQRQSTDSSVVNNNEAQHNKNHKQIQKFLNFFRWIFYLKWKEHSKETVTKQKPTSPPTVAKADQQNPSLAERRVSVIAVPTIHLESPPSTSTQISQTETPPPPPAPPLPHANSIQKRSIQNLTNASRETPQNPSETLSPLHTKLQSVRKANKDDDEDDNPKTFTAEVHPTTLDSPKSFREAPQTPPALPFNGSDLLAKKNQLKSSTSHPEKEAPTQALSKKPDEGSLTKKMQEAMDKTKGLNQKIAEKNKASDESSSTSDSDSDSDWDP